MNDLAQGAFPETVEKDVLRERDLQLLATLMAAKGRRLGYLGMSGEKARDVLKWQDALDTIVVVERPFETALKEQQFRTNVLLTLTPVFNGRVAIVISDIWEYLAGKDFPSPHAFPDVINLDFCGGLINQVQMDYPKQRRAFHRVFEAASKNGEDFILLMTLMPRDSGNKSYKAFLEQHVQSLGKDFPKGADGLAATERFHEASNLTLFKACIPLLLDEVGRSHNYSVRPAYVRLYTKMIHFAFRCTFVKGVLGLASDTSFVLDTLNAPMRKLAPDGSETIEWPPRVRTH